MNLWKRPSSNRGTQSVKGVACSEPLENMIHTEIIGYSSRKWWQPFFSPPSPSRAEQRSTLSREATEKILSFLPICLLHLLRHAARARVALPTRDFQWATALFLMHAILVDHMKKNSIQSNILFDKKYRLCELQFLSNGKRNPFIKSINYASANEHDSLIYAIAYCKDTIVFKSFSKRRPAGCDHEGFRNALITKEWTRKRETKHGTPPFKRHSTKRKAMFM